MLVPLEVAVLLVAVGVGLVWDAFHHERRAIERVALVLTALGAMMIAIAGRFPLPPGSTGFSPFVVAGAMVVAASGALSAVATAVTLIQERRSRSRGQPTGGAG